MGQFLWLWWGGWFCYNGNLFRRFFLAVEKMVELFASLCRSVFRAVEPAQNHPSVNAKVIGGVARVQAAQSQ